MKFVFALLACLFSLPGAAIDLQPLESGDYPKLIAALPKPALVVLWSIDCAPCQREMPEVARLMRDSRVAAVVLISTDDVEASAAILDSIRSAGFPPGVRARVFGRTDATRLRHEIDPGWHGETPRHYLITTTKTHGWSGPLGAGPVAPRSPL